MSHTQSNRQPSLVPAVFGSREQAETGILALRAFGLTDADIGVAVATPGRYQYREPSDREVFTAAGQGAATGGVIGSIGGITLLSVSLGEVAAVGGGLLAMASGGLIWGAVIGDSSDSLRGYVGVLRKTAGLKFLWRRTRSWLLRECRIRLKKTRSRHSSRMPAREPCWINSMGHQTGTSSSSSIPLASPAPAAS